MLTNRAVILVTAVSVDRFSKTFLAAVLRFRAVALTGTTFVPPSAGR